MLGIPRTDEIYSLLMALTNCTCDQETRVIKLEQSYRNFVVLQVILDRHYFLNAAQLPLVDGIGPIFF